MIKKLLIANRGEIAVRIIRSCRELGIKTVAIYSEVDRKALHVRYADEAYAIGSAPSNESYLKADKIIEVAKQAKVDAIHPGYGFLSENADFAKTIAEAGIIFIGPSPYAIQVMGDKITARKHMIAAKVPVVPGIEGNYNIDEWNQIIKEKIGFPAMIKASAGGGGKGMRIVKHEKELETSLRAAQSEALNAFGDDSFYVEKYIESPHHIEFQILGDSHGNIIHLGERECSVQRRHQKIIEESPSPIMTSELRVKMGEFAVEVAKSVNYVGAGTIEFLVDDDSNFYFLEMNTRLQVEHPITERVTGFDLVKEQIRIANGETLAYSQSDIKQDGNAIECRIYAEDPDRNFMPSPGLIKKITEPLGFGVRSDGYVFEGYEIPMHYDPMISKLIVWGKTREEAVNRMHRSLEEYYIMGIRTNINFLKNIMEEKDFRQGNYNTHYIDTHMQSLLNPCAANERIEDFAMITSLLAYLDDFHIDGVRNLSNSEVNWRKNSIKEALGK